NDVAARLWPFVLLLALSAGTSPYLSLMVLGIALAAVARTWLVRDKPSAVSPADSRAPLGEPTHPRSMIDRALHSPLASIGALTLSLLLSLIFFGFITPGSMPAISGGDYGAYSMNLLAPINPSGSSVIFRSFAVLPLQAFEGYNYLGAGIIALGVLCVIRDPALLGNLWGRPLRPLVV